MRCSKMLLGRGQGSKNLPTTSHCWPLWSTLLNGSISEIYQKPTRNTHQVGHGHW